MNGRSVELTAASSSAEIREIGGALGRGVFATRTINSGEIVEVCPVIVVLAVWDDMPHDVRTIVFDWGQLTNGPKASCIALGWGSLYNHGNPANLRYRASPNELSLIFTAARDIVSGEQLTVNYNGTLGDISSSSDDWFEDTGVRPIYIG